jgi:hypothetical protein
LLTALLATYEQSARSFFDEVKTTSENELLRMQKTWKSFGLEALALGRRKCGIAFYLGAWEWGGG